MAPVRIALLEAKFRIKYIFARSFCVLGDCSPELPDWFKYPEGGKDDIVSDDDFVLPSETEFSVTNIDKLKTYVPREEMNFVSVIPNGVDDADVDAICDIMKLRFASPEAVSEALDSCNVTVTKEMVCKILGRFSNEWVLAFGFFVWAGRQDCYYHTPDCYDLMVDILGKLKRFDVMWGLIDEMVCRRNVVSLATVTKVMRRLAGACRWNDAIMTFRNIEHFGVQKNTEAMNALLDTLCKERSVKRASDTFMELRAVVPPNASSFNVLIHGWCKARRLEEARRVMEEMKDFGYSPCVITYTSLIEAYCMVKNFQMVESLLVEMHANGCYPNVVTYTIFMHSLGKARKTQEALEVFEKMKNNGCVPDTSCYNSLIYILGRAGKLQEASSIFEEMCKKDVSPNITTFSTLISAFCNHSQENNAFKLLYKMHESSCKADVKTYMPLLKLCYKRKWIKILLYLLAHMFKKDISLDLGTYTLLVHGLCRNGKLEYSCLCFEEMVLKGLIPKQHTCNNLIKALEKNNMEKAKLKVQQLMVHAENLKERSSIHVDNK